MGYEYNISTKEVEEITRKAADIRGITFEQFMKAQNDFNEFKESQKEISKLNKAIHRVQENKDLYENYYIDFHKDNFGEQNLDIPTIRMGFNDGFNEAIYRILLEYERLSES